MATKKARAKTPREQSPKLIGLTLQEAKALEKAAVRCEIPCAQFIREAALAHAATINGGGK